MSYTVNLGCWGSIFAVPTDIVDKYLKISGSAQLKVLLYILRHSGEQFELETIAQHLNMGTFDFKDCIEFWSSFNIIAVNNDVNSCSVKIPVRNDMEYIGFLSLNNTKVVSQNGYIDIVLDGNYFPSTLDNIEIHIKKLIKKFKDIRINLRIKDLNEDFK